MVAFLIVESFDNLVAEIVGRRHAIVATLAGSLFLFIACCNIAGQLPGVHPATGSLATTSALAVVVFPERSDRRHPQPTACGDTSNITFAPIRC